MFDDERLPEAKHPPAAPVVPAGSGEAEDAALLRPGQRQAGMGEQLLRGKVARVAAFEDRPGNVRGEVAKPQHAGEVGARHPLALRDIGAGELVRKYGWPIGRALQPIASGAHVHTANLGTRLEGLNEYVYRPVSAADSAPVSVSLTS